MIKSKRGITLVALVITIIILLILAGITISQLTGSGLFENAKLAEQRSKEAQEKEDGILADYENKIDSYLDGSNRQENISSVHPKGQAVIVDSGDFSAIKTYIAPDDGWVVLKAKASGGGGKYYFFKVGELEEAGGCANEWLNHFVSLPCLKGQEINYQVWGANVSGELKFIPMK